MKTLTLSGWTQPADALAVALGLPQALQFDYSDYAGPEESYAGLQNLADAEHVIGWSMGGQLAIRAIAAGVLKPKRLTLVAAPYQFVSDAGFNGGMDPITFQQFRDSYARDAARTKQRFHALIAKGDRDPRGVMGLLGYHPDVENTARWLPWLERLGADSLREVDMSLLPPTLIIHGENDAITPIAQSVALAEKLPQAVVDRWEETGHAPHLRDRLRLLGRMEQHLAS